MRLSIRRKIVVFIVVPVFVICGVVIGLSLLGIRTRSIQHLEDETTRLAQQYASELDGRFETAAQVARSTAKFLELHPDVTEDQIYAILRSNIEQNPLIYGAAIGFEPFSFYEQRRLFSPYACRDGDGLRQLDIGASYAYDTGEHEWWSRPRALNRALWTQPYFDEGAGDILMCTYSVPFYRDGEFWGIATIDIPLVDLQKEAGIDALRGRQYSILAADGVIVADSDPRLIMQNALDIAAERGGAQSVEVIERMLAGKAGTAKVHGEQFNYEPGRYWVFYAPIESAGWSFVSWVPESEALAFVRGQLRRALIGLIVALVLIGVCVWWVSGQITRPIQKLNEGVQRVAGGDLDTPPVRIGSRDEIGDLEQAFNRMVADLRGHVDALAREHAAREAVEGELRAARQIQFSLLPQIFPPYPDRSDIDLHAVISPAKEVAGDFFDFFFVDDHTLFFTIADVSGKGVPAALFMAVTRTLFRNIAAVTRDPGELMTRCNRTLVKDNTGSMFVTVFLAFYDTRDNTIAYTNAGHPPPYRIDAQRNVTPFGEVTDTLLGIIPDMRYNSAQERLSPGDRLVLYTDGVTEARSPESEFLRSTGLEAMLHEIAGGDSQTICDELVARVNAYQHDARHDDVTVLTIGRPDAPATRGPDHAA